MKTFTWKITNLNRLISDGYVYTAHYVVEASDGIRVVSGESTVSLERPDNLIPYESLTEDVVIGWVKTHLGAETVKSIEDNLSKKLDSLASPTTAKGVPWPEFIDDEVPLD